MLSSVITFEDEWIYVIDKKKKIGKETGKRKKKRVVPHFLAIKCESCFKFDPRAIAEAISVFETKRRVSFDSFGREPFSRLKESLYLSSVDKLMKISLALRLFLNSFLFLPFPLSHSTHVNVKRCS